MSRFVVGDDRSQSTLFPERLDDYLGEDNPVRAIDVFVDELDLARLGFGGVEPEATGRPAYHPATLLKIYVRLDRNPSKMRLRRQTVEHPFGTIKSWMGSTHFQMKSLKHVGTEMALHVLAYNMKRVMSILGVAGLIEAIRA